MTPIEIIALILAVVVAVKLLVIMIKPKAWMNVVEVVYRKPTLLMVVSLILAAVVLYYLDFAGITIVQIFAVMVFFALLAAMTASAYAKEIIVLARKMLKDKSVLKKAWLALVVWIVLVVWVLYTLFA